MQIYSGLPGLCAGVAWLLVPYVAPFMADTHEFIITRSYTGTRYSECNSLARVIYSSLYLGTPTGAYRFLVCYIQSIVVDVLSPIATLVCSGGCACIVLYPLYMHTIVFGTTVVVPHNIVCPPHVLYRYVEHFVIFVLCLSANTM